MVSPAGWLVSAGIQRLKSIPMKRMPPLIGSTTGGVTLRFSLPGRTPLGHLAAIISRGLDSHRVRRRLL